jgi:hypothetical protein
MDPSSFEDPMFSEFPTDSVLSPMGPKAIPHHFITHHHHHQHHQQHMLGNGDINQHQRLPDVQQILPGNSPKMDHHYKQSLEYGHVKIEQQQYSPSNKMEFLNGNKLEYTTNGQYSPNAKIIEYTTGPAGIATNTTQHIEHIQMFPQPQPLDGNQQGIINGEGNFKRKSDENLNNLSGSPTPTTINGIGDGSASVSPSKKPIDKKKNDPNGVKKKKTR